MIRTDYEKSYDGSMLKYTIAKWATGKAKQIDKIGISPDKEIILESEDFEK